MTLPDNYQSIQLIMNKYQKSFNFKFGLISTNHLRKYIDEIGCDKSSSGDIPANIIKMAEQEVIVLYDCINKFYQALFLINLIIADVLKLNYMLTFLQSTNNKTLMAKVIIDHLVCYHTFQRYLKRFLMNCQELLLMKYFL